MLSVNRNISTASIILNGTLDSPLNWEAEKEEARKENTRPILWKIDLGLFSRLQFPLSNQVQFLSLKSALEHFCETVLPEFQQKTEGVCIYSGTPDFSHAFPWDLELSLRFQEWIEEAFDLLELNQILTTRVRSYSDITHDQILPEKRSHLLRLFCLDVATEYFKGIFSSLPAAIVSYIEYDAAMIKSPLVCAEALVKERYGRIHLIVNNSPFPKSDCAKKGICIPIGILARRFSYQEMEQFLLNLLKKKEVFRLLTEDNLTSQWDGLDEIYLLPNTISSQGMRKLQGFSAAGGNIELLV